jgi:hypothetical protein
MDGLTARDAGQVSPPASHPRRSSPGGPLLTRGSGAALLSLLGHRLGHIHFDTSSAAVAGTEVEPLSTCLPERGSHRACEPFNRERYPVQPDTPESSLIVNGGSGSVANPNPVGQTDG